MSTDSAFVALYVLIAIAMIVITLVGLRLFEAAEDYVEALRGWRRWTVGLLVALIVIAAVIAVSYGALSIIGRAAAHLGGRV